VIRFPVKNNLAQNPVLMRHNGQGGMKLKFQNVTAQGGPYFSKGHRGRGLAVADLDNDGLADLAINHINEPPAVLKNLCPDKNRWLGVQLQGTKFADVVGARVVLELGERRITQFQKGGSSYASARDSRLLFGLGKGDKVGRLSVYWASGTPSVEHWDNLETKRYHTLFQGTSGTK
jgi:hypothetical protein